MTCRPAPMYVSHLMGPVDLSRNCASLAVQTGPFLNRLLAFCDYQQTHFWPLHPHPLVRALRKHAPSEFAAVPSAKAAGTARGHN